MILVWSGSGCEGISWTRKMGEKSGGDLRGLLGWVGLRGGLSGLIYFIRLETKLQGRSVVSVNDRVESNRIYSRSRREE